MDEYTDYDIVTGPYWSITSHLSMPQTTPGKVSQGKRDKVQVPRDFEQYYKSSHKANQIDLVASHLDSPICCPEVNRSTFSYRKQFILINV